MHGPNIKVLIIASGDLWAGAEVMICQLISSLRGNLSLDLYIVLLNKNRLAKELESQGINVTILDESIFSFYTILRQLKNVVKEFSPDIIHSHRYKENFLAWLASLGNSRIKLVATQHGMPEILGAGFHLKNKLRDLFFFRLLSCCFDRTVLVSYEMRKTLIGTFGFSEKNISVIHNGIKIHKCGPRQIKKTLIVGSAGRLFPVKDYSLLINVAKDVISKNNTVEFVIAGEGPLQNKLEREIKNLGIQNQCRLIGHQNNMDAFYQNIDIYINTSVHEGIPMSVLEAMSYGLPVIIPKVGGLPEIIKNNIQGFLIVKRKKEIYVERLLQLTNDKELLKKMGRSARKKAIESFSKEFMASKYYDLYNKLMLNS